MTRKQQAKPASKETREQKPAPGTRNKAGQFVKGTSGNPKRQFTSTNQPPVSVKRQAQLEHYRDKKLAQEILGLSFQGAQDSDLLPRARLYFGLEPGDKVTVEMMMIFRQAEKAIGKADTAAFRAVLERAHGMPKQVNEHSFGAGAVVKIGGKKLE